MKEWDAIRYGTYSLTKETLGILYWIGMWSLIMPSKDDKYAVAWVCFSFGILGVFGCAVTDRLFARPQPTL